MIRIFIKMFILSECSSDSSSGQNVHTCQNVQNLNSWTIISCVRFCIVFIKKFVYNLKHLMFGYKEISLRFNHHVKPQPSIKYLFTFSQTASFSFLPTTFQFPLFQCKLSNHFFSFP